MPISQDYCICCRKVKKKRDDKPIEMTSILKLKKLKKTRKRKDNAILHFTIVLAVLLDYLKIKFCFVLNYGYLNDDQYLLNLE